MINTAQYKSGFDRLITDEHKKASIYIIGSASQGVKAPFNVSLSDVDLMMIAPSTSLNSLVDLVKRACILSHHFNERQEDAVELFFTLPHTASFFLSYFSVIAGINQLLEKDRLFGEQFTPIDMRSKAIAHRMYRHAAIDLCYEFAKKLPNADTKYARRTAKRVLRALKIVICAQASAEDFELIEARLLHLHSFEDLAEFLPEPYRQGMTPIWRHVLGGKDIDDWPRWMKEQNDMAMLFAQWAQEFKYDVKEHQFYSTLYSLRDLLVVEAKNIICEGDEITQGILIGQYADKLAGVVAKMALFDVPNLKDLSTHTTPAHVRGAYFKILEHLQNERNDIECFTASIVLGDYALCQAMKYLTRDSKAEVL